MSHVGVAETKETCVGEWGGRGSATDTMEPFYGWYWCMPRKKEGRFWGEAGAV